MRYACTNTPESCVGNEIASGNTCRDSSGATGEATVEGTGTGPLCTDGESCCKFENGAGGTAFKCIPKGTSCIPPSETLAPSPRPSTSPSQTESLTPSASLLPSMTPTSKSPTLQPSSGPSLSPVIDPTTNPSNSPTSSSTNPPTRQPSDPPSSSPTCGNNVNICFALDISGSVCSSSAQPRVCTNCLDQGIYDTAVCGDIGFDPTLTCCANFGLVSFSQAFQVSYYILSYSHLISTLFMITDGRLCY